MAGTSLSNSQPHLPTPLTAIVGREREAAALVDLILGGARLLTLTGPGGVGKTRLALQVAADLAHAFPEGVFFIPLAPISDPALVIPTIARGLGLQESSDEAHAARLTTFLQDRRLLLILDNFEQVVDAAPVVTELLGSCQALQIVVTSRVRLRVSGEREHTVPSLALPAQAEHLSIQEIAESEAVRLFVERAIAVKDDFVLTDSDAPAIAEICRRLDGLPLAIELAAARLKILPPAALLARLERRLPLLTGGGRDLPTRQQTMRDTIAWSYDLLHPAERQLFRRLAVFVGGFTLEAAEAVAGGHGELEREVFDGIASLVEQSLLRQESGPFGDPRFLMLETVREFGLDALADSDDIEPVRARHAAWCLALSERAAQALQGPEQAEWLARLDADHDNLRAALGWLRERAKVAEGLRLGAALAEFWLRRGHLTEGRAQLGALLALAGTNAMTTERATVLTACAALAEAQSDFPAAQAAGEEALALWRHLGDQLGAAKTLLRLAATAKPVEHETALATESLSLFRAAGDHRSLAWALTDIAGLARDRGDLVTARAMLEESVALFRELGERITVAWPLTGLALLAWWEGDNQSPGPLLAESLPLFREVGDRRGLTYVLTILGFVAWAKGELEQSAALYQEALALARETGDRRQVAYLHVSLGDTAQDAGRHDEARSLYVAALPVLQDVFTPWGISWCLQGLAGLDLSQGEPVRATRFLAVAAALREAHVLPGPPTRHARLERMVAIAREQLGSVAFAAAWNEGQAMALSDVIAEALTPPQPPEVDGGARPRAERMPKTGLTPRELDVLRLLVEGRSDREIAAALFIGPRTVQTHVANLFAKLGVNARAEAAAVAVRRGIV